jgi:predicted dehydrogenase
MKVAIVGAGFMGGVHAACYQKIDDVEIAAVVDVRQEQREKLAGEHGATAYERLESVLADATLDIVDCCLPTYLHRDCVVAALDAGKHVLCEKPFATSLQECDDMIAASKRAGRKFMIAQVIRFWPEYAATKVYVDTGALGDILAVVAHRLASPPGWSQDNWLLQPAKSLGAVVDMQVHDLDFVRYLLGDPVSLTSNALLSETGALDHVFTNLKYEKHLAFTEASFLMPPNWPFRMDLRIVGTEATLEMDITRDPTLRVIDGKGETTALPVSDKDGYQAEIEHFCAAVRDDTPLTVAPPEDSRLSMKLALCSKQAAETGEIVPF